MFTGTESTTLDLMCAFIKAATIHTQNMSIPLITGEGRSHHGEILLEAAVLVDAGELKPADRSEPHCGPYGRKCFVSDIVQDVLFDYLIESRNH